MVTDQRPLVECKNASCHHTIWLPRSSQLDRFPGQIEFADNQYSEIYVCPSCAHVFDYRPLNVRWYPRQIADRDHTGGWYATLLEFDCATENCGVRVVIRKPTDAPQTSDQLVKESEGWVLAEVHCPAGHPITTLPLHRWGGMFVRDL